jgi:2,3-bisphosphoglycerate-dependent phosphoglycerate mutase
MHPYGKLRKIYNTTAATMKTEFLLIRHGETLYNSQGRMQGLIDSPLTDIGIRQAKAAAGALSGKTFEAVYSSPLGRARKTAEIISQPLDCPLHFDPDLQERNMGIFQGLTTKEAASRFPDDFVIFKSHDPDYIIPNGESFRQKDDRGIECMRQIAKKHPGGKVVVITHGGILDAIFRHTLFISLDQQRRYSIFNCAFNSIEIEGDSWRLITWGDMNHLRDIGSLDEELAG